MSKAAKLSIFIFLILIAVLLGGIGFISLEKQKIEQQKISLENELQASRDREKKNLGEVKSLKDQLAQETGEKSKFKNTIDGLEKHVEELLAQISDITADRDKWQARLEEIKKERGELLSKVEELTAKLQEKPQVVYQEKIVYKERGSEAAAQTSGPVPEGNNNSPDSDSTASSENADEQDVAQLLKEKAALEAKVNKFQADLSQNSLEIVDLKQANESLRMDLDTALQEKQSIADDMKEKEDTINRLSLELARARNDKQFVAQKVDQLTQKNMQLHQDLKKLSDAKMALEKSIVQIAQEKDSVSHKLEQADAVLQNKISEVWEVKDSLDRSFKSVQEKSGAATNEVELSPIVVNTQGAALAPAGETKPGFEGKVMSVNDQNNFVIVDIGEKRGLRVGDTLGVYRGSDYIARLEVLQVRPDIAAADLKEQNSKVKIGDVVR